MKREFLEGLGLEKDVIDKIMTENGNDINAEKAKTTKAEADRDKFKEQYETATAELDKFKDVKPEELQDTIKKLQDDLKAKDDEYAKKEADRIFNDSVKEVIKKKGGRSDKAIMAMMDLDTLKESKNQAADIEAAIDALAKESDFLFDSGEPIKKATGPVGGGGGTGMDAKTAAMRAAAGLPPAKE